MIAHLVSAYHPHRSSITLRSRCLTSGSPRTFLPPRRSRAPQSLFHRSAMSRTKSPLFAFSVLALLLMIGLAAPVLAKAQSLEVNFRTPRALSTTRFAR